MGATANITDNQSTRVTWLADTGKSIDYNDEGNINSSDIVYRTEDTSLDGISNALNYTAERGAEAPGLTVRCGRWEISTFLAKT